MSVVFKPPPKFTICPNPVSYIMWNANGILVVLKSTLHQKPGRGDISSKLHIYALPTTTIQFNSRQKSMVHCGNDTMRGRHITITRNAVQIPSQRSEYVTLQNSLSFCGSASKFIDLFTSSSSLPGSTESVTWFSLFAARVFLTTTRQSVSKEAGLWRITKTS